MSPPAARDPRSVLLSAVRKASPAEFASDEEIGADIIRFVILGLPPEVEATGDEVGKPNPDEAAGALDRATPVRLSIRGGLVKGRVDLASIATKEGGSLCPIEFEGTLFEGGFSGANCRFSRLSFRGCKFRDGELTGAWPPVPTINLSRATIEAGLELRGLRPDTAADHLWVRAANARIAGSVDLSCSHLRAPADDPRRRLLSEQTIDALNLARAEVRGDLLILSGARSEGRVNGRGVHIGGDLWLSGATLEAKGAQALFLQSATISGMVMLDGRPDRADSSGPLRSFVCAGDLSLRAAEIGDDLHMEDSLVGGRIDFLDLEVKNDVILRTAVRGSIDLTGCRIGGMVDVSRLKVGVDFSHLSMRDGTIGRSLKRKAGPRPMKLLAARSFRLTCLPEAYLLETLWLDAEGQLRQVGWIAKGDLRFPLDGFRSGLDNAVAVIGHSVTDEAKAAEFLRLYASYAPGEGAFPLVESKELKRRAPFARPVGGRAKLDALPAEFFAISANAEGGGYTVNAGFMENGRLCRCAFHLVGSDRAVQVRKTRQLEDGPDFECGPRYEAPYILHPPLSDGDIEAAIERKTWPLAAFLPNKVEIGEKKLAALEAVLWPQLLEFAFLRRTISFENLSCDVLDDEAGRNWGDGIRVQMNQFVYRRARWHLRTYESKSSFRRIADWWRTIEAEWLWPSWLNLGRTRDSLRNSDDYWEPWQLRRNWIYRQFEAEPDLVSISRHKVREFEYRPQPFEQAIRVARAEGREDYATHFEMLKQRIEWRLANRRIRWPLAFLAIFAAYLWLWHIRGHSWTADMALLWIWGVMLFVSSIRKGVAKRLPAGSKWLSKWVVVPLLFALPALLVYFGEGWWLDPLHFFIALLIFASLRLVSVFAHFVMRFLFGYLRRPVRAIVSLIAAFLIGWWGVSEANDRQLLVVDANPVAGLVGDGSNSALIGSEREDNPKLVASDIHCGDRISEPLYALDVLIPLIDLREENRCEVGRADTAPRALPGPPPGSGLTGLRDAVPALTVHDEGFWAVMKALYAVAGWFLVSLSILTFAHINRAPREPG